MNVSNPALLLVEDSPDDEILSLFAIENCGVPCRVDVIRHGGDVLATLLASTEPLPDLIVLDYHLPGLNGLEILRQIRNHPRTRHIPVVILSAEASENQIKACLEDGANSCVEKPRDACRYIQNVGDLARYWLTLDRRPQQVRGY